MQLDKANRGQVVRITEIPDQRIRLHAIRFGLAEGDVVTCQEIVPAGPVVVSHNKREIAIGRKLAKSILVEPFEVSQS
ncbi:MAG: FeoA family protein [Pelotomaculum sp.]|jgi:Fe2+ transport system protein FeoA